MEERKGGEGRGRRKGGRGWRRAWGGKGKADKEKSSYHSRMGHGFGNLCQGQTRLHLEEVDEIDARQRKQLMLVVVLV